MIFGGRDPLRSGPPLEGALDGALVGALFLGVLLVIDVFGFTPIQGGAIVSAIPAATLLARPLAAQLPVALASASGALLLAAGLVGLAFLVARPHVPDPATEPYAGVRGASRAKAAGLEVHFKRDGVEAGVEPATVLHAGDTLRFVVRGERARHVEVRLRDGGGAAATVFPAGAGETPLVQPRETLPIRPVVGAGGASSTCLRRVTGTATG